MAVRPDLELARPQPCPDCGHGLLDHKPKLAEDAAICQVLECTCVLTRTRLVSS